MRFDGVIALGKGMALVVASAFAIATVGNVVPVSGQGRAFVRRGGWKLGMGRTRAVGYAEGWKSIVG